MTKDDDRVKAIFTEAIEHAPDQWHALLDEACGDEPELRRRIEALLEAHGEEDSLLDRPAPTVDRSMERPELVIGRYKLREKLGEGGFGVVWAAEQLEPVRRKVALKVIKPGMDSAAVIARFEAERQALALMDHPNVARVLDAGTTPHGRPFFVMDLIRGVPITQYCDDHRLTVPERLHLFILVCKAVQHAHQKGLIHRDIKPSNVLVTMQDDVPTPKIIDFGVAKALHARLSNQSIYTGVFQAVGTLAYMSPEQAELSGNDIDTRADIYGLGVVLFELLTGATPFDRQRLESAALNEACRIIREEDPPRASVLLSTSGDSLASLSSQRRTAPSRLCQLLSGELDWITLKSLAKDRRERYETANEFAEDIQRYLNRQPVIAGPPSTLYKLRKFVRRNMAAVLTVVLITVAAFFAVAFIAHMAVANARLAERSRRDKEAAFTALENAKQAKRALQQELLKRKRLQYIADMRIAGQLLERKNSDRVIQLLRKYDPQEGTEDLRTFEWYLLKREAEPSVATPVLSHGDFKVTCFALSPDESILATAGSDNTCNLWHTQTGQLLRSLKGHTNWIRSVAFSPDGTYVATGSSDKTLRFWDVLSGEETQRYTWKSEKQLGADEHKIRGICFSPDGQKIAVGFHDCVAKVLDTATLHEEGTFDGHYTCVWYVAFSNDGTKLITADPLITKVWDVETRTELYTIKEEADELWVQFDKPNSSYVHPRDMCVRFSPDSKRILQWRIRSKQGPVVKDAATGEPLFELDGAGRTNEAVFSPDGTLIATAGKNGSVQVWDASNGKCRSTLSNDWQSRPTWALAFSEDCRTLATGGFYNDVRIWDAANGNLKKSLRGHSRVVGAVKFLSIRQILISKSDDQSLRLWNLRQDPAPAQVQAHREAVNAISISQDDLVITGGDDGAVRVWELDTAALIAEHQNRDTRVLGVAITPDAKRIAWTTNDGRVMTAHVTPEITPRTLDVTGDAKFVAFSPTGDILGVAGPGIIEFWHADDRSRQFAIKVQDTRPTDFTFSADGRQIAYAAQSGLVHLFDTTTGDEIDVQSRYKYAWHRAYPVAEFLPRGNRLVIGDNDGTLGLLTADGESQQHVLRDHSGWITAVDVSPDGETIASGSTDKTVKLWDTKTGELRLTLSDHEDAIKCLAFSTDTGALVSGDERGTLRFWRTSKAEKTSIMDGADARDRPRSK